MADAKQVQNEISRLTKYLDNVKTRMSSAIPEKHKNRPNEYKAWLKLEFKRTSKKIESLKV